ncbi:hypothetical protein JHK82_047821 [Glycine max]|nr:hypothetical protein JHK82_047821 [Glycine max]
MLSSNPLTRAKREGGAKRNVVNSEPIQSLSCAELGGASSVGVRHQHKAEEIYTAAVRAVKEETGDYSQFLAPIELANGLVEFSPLVVVMMSKSSSHPWQQVCS